MIKNVIKYHHCYPHLLQSFSPISKPSSSLNYTFSHAFSNSLSFSSHKPKASNFSHNIPSLWANEQTQEPNFDYGPAQLDDLAHDSPVYKNTLRLVESSMFAAISALAYFLSDSLGIENYFGCFFALPIVITSMRWGVAAGRKTMVATTVLLFVLSGPVKPLTYVLMHGLLGFTMGSLWRLQVNWRTSIFLCTLVRAIGALGYVLTSSFLINENILALSMNPIYVIFGTLVLVNSSFFVFLLHILYALFLARLGMKTSLMLPKWLENAL